MKKFKMTKVANGLMAAVLSLSMLFSGLAPVPVYADEDTDESYEDIDVGEFYDFDDNDDFDDVGGFDDLKGDDVKETEQEITEPPKEPKPVIETGWMRVSTDKLSFGQISKGEKAIEFQSFTVTNNGQREHVVGYSINDPDGAWYIDAPDNNIIKPGESLEFSVLPNTNKDDGTYKAAILVSELISGSQVETAAVKLSVTIYASKPWIKYVAVSPQSQTLSPGSSYGFTAEVECGEGADAGVDWSIKGAQSSGTSIDSDGVLTVAGDESASSFTVIAASKQDPSFKGKANVTIKKSSYTVTTESVPSRGGIAAGGGSFSSGESVTVTANPSGGYVFDGWYIGSKRVASTQKYTFTVTDNTNLIAQFSQDLVRVTVKRNNKKGGKVSDSKTIDYGGSITLKAYPNDGYVFDGWFEDDERLSKKESFKLEDVTCDMEVTAVFKPEKYSITASSNPAAGGSIDGTGKYKAGEKAALTAKPAKGYRFVSWVCNSKVVGTDKKLVIKDISKDYDVTAIFQAEEVKIKTYTITAGTDSANGVISPSGKIPMQEGKAIAFTVAPKSGYRIADVKVDGVSLGAVVGYSFGSVNANHTITASFVKNEVTAAQVNNNLVKDYSQNAQKNSCDVTEKEIVEKKEIAEKAAAESEGKVESEIGDDEEEITYLGGVLQDANLTEDEAWDVIENGDDRPLMEAALYNGDLRVSVMNSYADNPVETTEKSYYDIVSVPNLNEVIDSMLPDDTKMAMFLGMPVGINLCIRDYDDEVTDDEVSVMDNNSGADVTLGNFFDVSFLVDMNGDTKYVKKINKPMKIIMNVPENLLESGDEVVVVRLHEGEVSVLEDMDSVDETVTFETDRFSTYAFATRKSAAVEGSSEEVSPASQSEASAAAEPSAQHNVKADDKPDGILIGLIVFCVVLIIVLAVITAARSAARKRRRHNRRR